SNEKVPLLEVSRVGQSDDKARFLAEFRALRDRAAIDYEELAARTHYPSTVLKDAENGPGLPGLPVLAAYVRACGGDVAEWEERWRLLARAADDEAGLPTRPAGASAAAVAGARAGVTMGPAEAADTERIKAALRAHRQREEEESKVPHSADARVSGQPTMVTNGAHHKEPRAETFDKSVASAAATAAARSPVQRPAVAADEGFQVFSGAPGSASADSSREKSGSAASTESPRVAAQSRNLTSRPGLLAAIVAVVVLVCIAALALTLAG